MNNISFYDVNFYLVTLTRFDNWELSFLGYAIFVL